MYSGVTVTDANATPHAIVGGTNGELIAIAHSAYTGIANSATRVGRWLGKSVNGVAALKIEL